MRRLTVALVAGAAWLCAVPVGAEQGWARGAGAAPVEIAQVPRGGAPRSPMSEAERRKMHQRMLDELVDRSDLTPAEKAAAKKALRVKDQAREALQAELTKLRRTANKEKPSPRELQDALAAYGRPMAQHRKKIEAADVALTKQLSLKGRARCLSLGILDNGLGPMGMAPGGFGPSGPRPGRPGL